MIVKKEKPTISLCMLVCNEEKVLSRCLESAKGLYDELVIVDTGSSDKSVEIAREYGAEIINVRWKDDFAWARNVGLKAATCDWVFLLDPDETLAPKDIKKFRHLTEIEGVQIWQIPTRNYTNNSFITGFMPSIGEYEEEKGFRGYVDSVKTRLFKNKLGLRFEGIVHEMIDYQAFRRKLVGRKASIPIHHRPEGKTPRSGHNKSFFMLSICEKKAELYPGDAQAWWELGAVQHILGMNTKAIESIKRSIKLGLKKPEHVFTIAMIMKSQKRMEESQRYFEKAICLMNPELTHVKKEYRELVI